MLENIDAYNTRITYIRIHVDPRWAVGALCAPTVVKITSHAFDIIAKAYGAAKLVPQLHYY